MGAMSLSHWLIVAIVVLVLFGRGRISETMADFGKGIRSFRHGLNEIEEPPQAVEKQIAPATHQDEQLEKN